MAMQTSEMDHEAVEESRLVLLTSYGHMDGRVRVRCLPGEVMPKGCKRV